MFDIGATELLVIVIVAILVIGPKDMPLALRTAGRWMGKVRRVSAQFRTGIDAMIREAELQDMEKEWREKNRAIMEQHPHVDDDGDGDRAGAPQMEPLAGAEARLRAEGDTGVRPPPPDDPAPRPAARPDEPRERPQQAGDKA